MTDLLENRIDLHTHSTDSDGTFTPEELMIHAKEIGLKAVALTDHDTISGIKKARSIAEKLELELVPGIELSTDYQNTEIHILGYYIQEDHPEFITKLQEFVDSREKRNEKMVALLQQEGFDITMENLYQENPDSVITRAHFARFLVEHGFIKDRKTVFQEYLGDGCKCYVGRQKITPFEAIQLIQLGGGLAFLAHPVLYHLEQNHLHSLIQNLKNAGLAGIEAIYSINTLEDEQHFRKLAEEFNLLISGGSDFHGNNKPDIKFGSGRYNLQIPYYILEEIKRKR